MPHPFLALPPVGPFVAPKATHLSSPPLHTFTVDNPEATALKNTYLLSTYWVQWHVSRPPVGLLLWS